MVAAPYPLFAFNDRFSKLSITVSGRVVEGFSGPLSRSFAAAVVEAIIGENKYPAINYSSTLEP